MDNSEDMYSIYTTDVPEAIEYVCNTLQIQPLEEISLIEATQLFNARFPVKDDGRHYLKQKEWHGFFDKLAHIAICRVLGRFAEDGLVDYAVDTNGEMIFSATEKGREYAKKNGIS